jgi:hypothetical protein
VVRTFVREYGFLFNNRVVPSHELLKKDAALVRGERLNNLSFWEYFVLVGEFDRNFPHELFARIPFSACSLIALK